MSKAPKDGWTALATRNHILGHSAWEQLPGAKLPVTQVEMLVQAGSIFTRIVKEARFETLQFRERKQLP